MKRTIRGLALIAGWWLLAGCQTSSTIECGTVICPADSACAESAGRCVAPEQLQACEGKAEGDACQIRDLTSGVCRSAVCISSSCGNGKIDGEEVCDDGNNDSGDGCRGDCLSDETCGNATVDGIVGEQCDDGNDVDDDGCTNHCAAVPCGNGVIDGVEVCDDANNQDGDGCNAQCSSDETCGNGVVDLKVGELCDDGNTEDGDGCQSTCTAPTCGDGVLDAVEACDDGNRESADGCNKTCTSDESCGNGIVDLNVGEQCDDGNLKAGDGCQSDCSAPTCGDGVLDPIEACDDGNKTPGDGCNATCTSDETCGNGVVDLVTLSGAKEQCDDGATEGGDGCGPTCAIEVCGNGILDVNEQCDDGGFARGDGCGPTCLREECHNGFLDAGEGCDFGEYLSHDGCSSQCTLETPAWKQWQYPLANSQAQLAFAGEHVVLFTKTPDGKQGLWIWDGQQWLPENSILRPDSIYATLVYDHAARELVLVASFTNSTIAREGEIWRRRAGAWIQESPNVLPPDRRNAGVVYDAARGKIVLFGGTGVQAIPGGGTTTGGDFDETWEYDGTTWQKAAPSVSPPAGEANRSMTYDPVGGTVVYLETVGSVWTLYRWVNGNWEATVGAPSSGTASNVALLVFDYAAGQLLLISGSGGDMRALYHFDGATWNYSTATGDRPIPTFDDAVVADPLRKKIIYFEGSAGRTVELSGSEWKLRSPLTPPIRRNHAAGYDPSRKGMVVFGGVAGQYYNDTWVWNGYGWVELETTNTPLPMNRTALIYDPVSEAMMMSGGAPSGTTLSDTFLLRENDWQTLQNSPLSPHRDHGFAYDSSRQRVVSLQLGLTWEWDGASWSDVSPATGAPPHRDEYGMTYDSLRKETLLYGGKLDDGIWGWDGTNWTNYPAKGPSARTEAPIAFHEKIGRTVLFGGSLGGLSFLGDTWEWAGGDWVATAPAGAPTARGEHTLVYMPEREAVVMFAGSQVGSDTSVWEYAYGSPVPDEACENGADDDGDARSDCEDPDCDGKLCGEYGLSCIGTSCQCPTGTTEVCGSHLDDDCDGTIDCDDPDCGGSSYCGAESNCDDGIDNDSDSATDCADPGCAGTGNCEAHETSCTDGIDNDGDGLSDCLDQADCYIFLGTTTCP